AVLIDENEEVIGRGLTNTRCNYFVATEVAKTEALNNARFFLIDRALDTTLGEERVPKQLLEELDGYFRVENQFVQLERLENTCLDIAHEQIKPVVKDIFARLNDEADSLFEAVKTDRSRFFRDLAGSRYFSLAEELANTRSLSFEALAAVYDKAILMVENQTLDINFGETTRQAFDALVTEKTRQNGGRNNQPGFLSSEILAAFAGAIEEASTNPLDITEMVGTGYGRQRLPFEKHQVRSEILCHGLGAHFMFPNTRTVLDIGGQDTKAIQVDDKGVVTNFQMNDRCAAGCGRYLGYIADELNLGLHELGPLSLQADRTCQICSTCTVFAGTELRNLLSLGEKRENILAGLHHAIILRAMSLLARSGGVEDEFTFTGGVAKNAAVVKALRELIDQNYGQKTLNIHTDSIYTGAIGAALYAHRAIDLEETNLA
ncbi:MAG: BadF/BadG/BcrA/BcrD ATPase family protein, partial [Rhodothermales bacterium]